MPELPEDVSISIDGRRFWGWSDLSLSKGIDVFSQASFVVPFEPENEAFRRTFSPYSYRDIAIDVGGQRFFTGVMFVNPSRAVNNRQVKVEAYASPAVLQDAHMPASAFPLEFRGLNLQQIGEALCGPFGLSVAFEAESIPPSPAVLAAQRKRRRARRRLQDIQEQREALAKNLHMRPGSIARQAGEETLDQLETFTRAELSAVRVPYAPPSPDAPFRRVRVKPDERPFVVLAELAKQRNVVINDMPDGTLRFWQSAKAGEPVARFVEGLPPIGDVAPRFQPDRKSVV